MASQSSTAQKPSSRWGLFLTGLESRLDTILADEDTVTKAAKPADGSAQEQPTKELMAVPTPGKPASSSRAASANRSQDRLNEKLAKAMATRNLGKKRDIAVTPSQEPSRKSSPVNSATSSRLSSEEPINAKIEGITRSSEENVVEWPETINNTSSEPDPQSFPITIASGNEGVIPSPIIAVEEAKGDPNAPRPSTDSRGSFSTQQSFELTSATTPNGTDSPRLNGNHTDSSLKTPEEYEKLLEQMRSDHEAAELRRQEETHTYLERIDALQSKLQYLTKEATETAKMVSADAKPGSIEQKIAAKDEKIALLIEEGQRLSQTELKHMSIIKTLRAKSTETDKFLTECRRMIEKHERSAREYQERAKRAELAEKRASQRANSLLKIEKDFESVRVDRDAKDSLIQDLQVRLSQATAAIKEAEIKSNAKALKIERQHAVELAEDLANARGEKDLAERQYQTELREMREKSEREKERARIAELERQSEQNILESRLEAYRARAEEASAGSEGDVQAKLLRQVEMLQNQYAVASENWQGIEGSLLSRVTALETEKDEITTREADIRRKARETKLKSRRMEEELERVNAKTEDMDHELSSCSDQIAGLLERLSRSEAEVAATRNDLKAERQNLEAHQAQRLEEEKTRIREESARSTPDALYQQLQSEFPVIQNRTRKSSNTDRNSGRRHQGLATTATGHQTLERPLSSRSSAQLLQNLQSPPIQAPQPMSRQESTSTMPQASLKNGIPETPSTKDRDEDFFDGVHTPATPDRTINDLISVSTAAAGPSVQLVERMSAAVRRLESEKASHKDELSRLSRQRDESREQVVDLMKEVEEKRGWEGRVKEMEKDMKGVEERYLTTLEMLGEKSEKVEELKADVQDLKGMYRELVESTMR